MSEFQPWTKSAAPKVRQERSLNGVQKTDTQTLRFLLITVFQEQKKADRP